jgi:predicted CoA-binding protein
MTARASIDQFLGLKRIAFVGVSRTENSYSRAVWAELRRRGYELLPVNSTANEIDGVPAAHELAELEPAPEGVLIMLPPGETKTVVQEAIDQGVRSIWFGRGTVSPEAVALARNAGCDVIEGECPFMFLAGTGAPHSWHRGIRTIFGQMPH